MMRKAYWLGLLLILIAYPLLAAQSNLHEAYQQGTSFAQSQQQQVIAASKNTQPEMVPGYTNTKALPKYSVRNLTQEAKAQAATNNTVVLIKNSYQKETAIQTAVTDKLLAKVKQIQQDQQQKLESNLGFCSDGTCAESHYTPSPDFEQAVSSLSAAAYASKDNISGLIFTGHRQTCRVGGFSYNDCCRDKGWGQDLHLAGCSIGEQQLGLAKQAGMCHAMGTYCDKRVLGVCVRHKQSYCCFNSKLARILQEQGRKQLRKGWGSAKYPNCQGLEPEQLQELDFSQMDMSEFYSDLHNKLQQPDLQAEQVRIKMQINARQP
jgi:hypothetical protein